MIAELTLTNALLSDNADAILVSLTSMSDPDDSAIYALTGSDALSLYQQLHRAMDALARRQDADEALAQRLMEVQP